MMYNPRITRRATAVALAALMTGCAGVQEASNIEAPKQSFVDAYTAEWGVRVDPASVRHTPRGAESRLCQYCPQP